MVVRSLTAALCKGLGKTIALGDLTGAGGVLFSVKRSLAFVVPMVLPI